MFRCVGDECSVVEARDECSVVRDRVLLLCRKQIFRCVGDECSVAQVMSVPLCR